jgi:hypothetical protein
VVGWHHTGWEAVSISLDELDHDDGDLVVLGVHVL